MKSHCAGLIEYNGEKCLLILLSPERNNLARFLARSGDKMLTLFEELKGSDAPTHLVEVK